MRFAKPSDRALVEEICNNPIIRVWTACDGAPACSALKYLTAPSFALFDERGCFLALCIDPGRYVIHTNLLPHCRGQAALDTCMEALHITFTQTDATELLTMVPDNAPHVRLVARAMGFRRVFAREAIWSVNGVKHGLGFYSMTLADWAASGACGKAGERFHAWLEGAHGKDHADDRAHNAFVGAALDMAVAGNLTKGVEMYNRWARFAMYQPISVVSTNPPCVNIVTCTVRLDGDKLVMEANHA